MKFHKTLDRRMNIKGEPACLRSRTGFLCLAILECFDVKKIKQPWLFVSFVLRQNDDWMVRSNIVIQNHDVMKEPQTSACGKE